MNHKFSILTLMFMIILLIPVSTAINADDDLSIEQNDLNLVEVVNKVDIQSNEDILKSSDSINQDLLNNKETEEHLVLNDQTPIASSQDFNEVSADLEIIKTANVKKLNVGNKIVWTITVINNGPNLASHVSVNDVATGDVEFVSFKTTKGLFNPLDGVWKIGDMENGETATLKIVGKALNEGNIINEANVSSDTPDPYSDNNNDISVCKVVEKINSKKSNDSSLKKYKAHISATQTIFTTANPIVMAILSIFAIFSLSFSRKN